MSNWLGATGYSPRIAILRIVLAGLSSARQACEVLGGPAKTFHLHPQASQLVHREHPPVAIERNHVSEHAAKGEGLRRLAQRIDKHVVPSTSIAHLCKHAMELGVRSFETCQ